MNQLLRAAERRGAMYSPQHPAKNESYKGTKFENFTEEQEKFVRQALRFLDPAGKIMPGIKKVVFDPSWATIAGFLPDPTDGTGTIIIGRIAKDDYKPQAHDVYSASEQSTAAGAFMHALGHEMLHYVSDASLHVKRDAKGQPVLDKKGKLTLTETGMKLYGSVENAIHVDRVFYRIADQSLATGAYLNYYQENLGVTYKALSGTIRTRIGMADYYANEAEKARAKAEAEPTEGNIERAEIAERESEAAALALQQARMEQSDTGFAFVHEGFTQAMTDQMFNPQMLRARSKLQQRAWKDGKFGRQNRGTGAKKDVKFIDPYRETQKLLMLVWGIEDGRLSDWRPSKGKNISKLIARQRELKYYVKNADLHMPDFV